MRVVPSGRYGCPEKAENDRSGDITVRGMGYVLPKTVVPPGPCLKWPIWAKIVCLELGEEGGEGTASMSYFVHKPDIPRTPSDVRKAAYKDMPAHKNGDPKAAIVELGYSFDFSLLENVNQAQ
jgi:hypothetical protein